MNVLIDTNVLIDFIAVREPFYAHALNDNGFADFEDCLQEQCALTFSADFIITRNVKEFESGSVPVIAPDIFCSRFLDSERS